MSPMHRARNPSAPRRSSRPAGLAILLSGFLALAPALAQPTAKPVPPPAAATRAPGAAQGATAHRNGTGSATAPVQSPYARAAGQHRNDPGAHARAESGMQAHGQSTLQSVAKPHKAHPSQASH